MDNNIIEDARIPKHIAATLADPCFYADGRIYDTFKWLRANNPLGLAVIDGFDPFWAITRHADIKYISSKNQFFRSGDKQFTFMDRASDERIRQINNGSPHLVKSLVSMDLPEHPKYRALTQAYFLPGPVRKLEGQIRAVAREFVDRMIATGGSCDFLEEVAFIYPLRVIMTIFGVPPEDEPIMLKLTQELFGAKDTEITQSLAVLSAEDEANYLHRTVLSFQEYFRKVATDRRANPKDDLISLIANSKIDGQPIDEASELGYYVTVATAGHDTTSSSTGVGMLQLMENPGEFAKLKADLSLIPKFVDEAIRWAAPIKSFMRSAAEDTEVSGRKISKGDSIMLCYPSGNRDESVYNDPDCFRVDREPNPHLSFGYGPHMCLGQHLAKLEMRVLFEELLPRLKSVKLAGEPRMIPACFISGPKKIPMHFELED